MGRRADRAAAAAREAVVDAATGARPTRRQLGAAAAVVVVSGGANVARQAGVMNTLSQTGSGGGKADSAGLIDRRGRRVEAR
jgi:hypothetical protein